MFKGSSAKIAGLLTAGNIRYASKFLTIFIFLQIFLWLPQTVHASQINYFNPSYYDLACRTQTPDGTVFRVPMTTLFKQNTPSKKIAKKIPSPSVPQNMSSSYSSLFEKYGSQYNVNPNVLHKIARCESGFNPKALSPSGAYAGLFQFVSSTWVSNRKNMGLDPNPVLRFDAEEATKTAAYKISRDGVGAWPVCGKS